MSRKGGEHGNIWQTVKDIAATLGDIGSALVGISTVILIFIHRPSRHGRR